MEVSRPLVGLSNGEEEVMESGLVTTEELAFGRDVWGK